MKVALFGAGRIGKVHAASIKSDPRSELVAVTDVMADAAEALALEHGINATTPEAILGDPSVDAILIASSTNTHADLIEAGVAAGKAIFCEKPIDLSLERARAVQRITADHHKPVMLGFNRRFDPNFMALKAALEAGEIGKGKRGLDPHRRVHRGASCKRVPADGGLGCGECRSGLCHENPDR